MHDSLIDFFDDEEQCIDCKCKNKHKKLDDQKLSSFIGDHVICGKLFLIEVRSKSYKELWQYEVDSDEIELLDFDGKYD